MTDGTDTSAAPAPAPAAAPPAAPSAPAPRQGVIADSAFQRLAPGDQQRYASVRGSDGGSEWVDRPTLPSATASPSTAPADPAKPSDPNARHRFGDTEFSEQEMRDF